MKVTVFHANECDRKKCTSIKMEKLGKCKLVYNINKIPSGAVVLNPFAQKAVSYEDYRYVHRRGVVGLDCILSTVEAVSATLYITRFKDEAKDILDGFKWGHTFLELNHDLLEAYSEADTSKDVVRVQNEFLESKE